MLWQSLDKVVVSVWGWGWLWMWNGVGIGVVMDVNVGWGGRRSPAYGWFMQVGHSLQACGVED